MERTPKTPKQIREWRGRPVVGDERACFKARAVKIRGESKTLVPYLKFRQDYLAFSGEIDSNPQSSVIESVGQASAQAPQPAQSSLTTATPSSRLRAPHGQASTQAPQPTQFSLFTEAAIVKLLFLF